MGYVSIHLRGALTSQLMRMYGRFNMMGSKMYPEGTNLLSPYSPIFKKGQRMWLFIEITTFL